MRDTAIELEYRSVQEWNLVLYQQQAELCYFTGLPNFSGGVEVIQKFTLLGIVRESSL